jgi:RimJ/RimL family protein N-acetyltransferase
MMISSSIDVRELDHIDREAAVAVINSAAEWYSEFLPPEEFAGPEMTAGDWDAEAERMTWYGAFEAGELIGVMGAEPVRDVVLMRHAYVLPSSQRSGIGSMLLRHAESNTAIERIIIGTYSANNKARNALEQAGYRLSADPEAVLREYYDIPEDRLQSSVTYERNRSS